MQLSSAFLCDFASVRDGLLSIIGGGITRLWRSGYPAPLHLCVALVVQLEPDELGRPHEFAVTLIDADGNSVVEALGGLNIVTADREDGENVSAPLALDLRNVLLPKDGSYWAEVSLDGKRVRSLPFWANTGAGPNP